MTEQEVLLEFSRILQERMNYVGACIQDLKETMERRFDIIEQRLDSVEKRLDIVEHRLDILEQRMSEVERRLDQVERRLDAVEQRLDEVERRLNDLECRVSDLECRVSSLEAEVRTLKGTMKDQVLPRLETIETCYISTYQRYASGAERIGSIQLDVDVLKRVVADHSKRLQELAV